MALTVEPIALPLPADVLDEVVSLRRAVDAVENPGDPPVGPGELVPDLFDD